MVLDIFKETGALLEGHFLLSSGRHSNRYVQCAKVMEYPQKAEEVVKKIVEKLENVDFDIVVGPAMGGIVVAYELGRQLGKPAIFTEREEGVMTLRRGFEIPKGARELVVEDVITTGGSTREVISIVEGQGAVVAGVGCLVDRSNGRIDFGVKMASCIAIEVEAYDRENCPWCKESLPLVKPGSRNLPKP